MEADIERNCAAHNVALLSFRQYDAGEDQQGPFTLLQLSAINLEGPLQMRWLEGWCTSAFLCPHYAGFGIDSGVVKRRLGGCS